MARFRAMRAARPASSTGRAIARGLEEGAKAGARDALSDPANVAGIALALPGRVRRARRRRHGLAGFWLAVRDGVLRPAGELALRGGIRAATGGLLG